jgi:hypothetical protein
VNSYREMLVQRKRVVWISFYMTGVSGSDSQQRAYSGGQSHGAGTQKVTRTVAMSTGASPICAARAPRRARNRSELPETAHMIADVGHARTAKRGRTAAFQTLLPGTVY